MAGKPVKLSVELESSSARQELGQLRGELQTLSKAGGGLELNGLAQSTNRARTQAEANLKGISKASTDAAKIATESISTISSELIESLGVDGDIANVFGAQIAGLRTSVLVLGGVVAGTVAAGAGLVALTVQLAGAARDLQLTADSLGISVERLQLYQRASEAAGVSTETLTGVFEKFKEETGGNEQAFDRFLRSLESVQSPTERLAIAQGRLGELSTDARRAILALTESQGELRRTIEQSGLVLSDFEARDLADTERRFELVEVKVKGFLKRGLLATIEGFTQFGIALGEGEEGLGRYLERQKRAEDATKNATNSITGQADAVRQLKAALDAVNASGIQAGLSQKITEIVQAVSAGAPRALSAKEAKAVLDNRFKIDPTLKEAVGVNSILQQNRKTFEDLIEPPSRGGGRTREKTPAEQLTESVAKLRKEIIALQTTGGTEYKLRFELGSLQAFKSQLEQYLKLRRELFDEGGGGIGQLQALQRATELIRNQRNVPLAPGNIEGLTAGLGTEADLNKLIQDSLPKTNELTNEQRLLVGDLTKQYAALSGVQKELVLDYAQATDKMIAQNQALTAFKSLQEQLNGQLQSFQNLSNEQTTALKLQGETYKNLTQAQKDQLLGLARQIDEQEAFKKQLDEAKQNAERFAGQVKGLFDTLFEQGPKAFFEQLRDTLKRSLAQMASDLVTSQALRLLGFSTGRQAAPAFGGGQAGSTGGGLLGSLFGGGGSSGGGVFGGLFGPGGTAGFNPGAALPGGGGLFGGGGGLLGALFGGGRAATPTLVGGLPTFPGGIPVPPLGGGGAAAASTGLGASLSSLGATGLIGGGFFGGSLLGGRSQIGKLLGGAGGGLLGGIAGASGLFGSGIAGSFGALAPLLTNPITAIVAGGLIGGALLFRYLSGGYQRGLRKQIRSEYAVDVKQQGVLKQIEELAKQQFGKEYKSKQAETVRLSSVRDLIASYAESTGQQGNSKLFKSADLQDGFSANNRFVLRRLGGGVIPGQTRGRDYIRLLVDGGEAVLNAQATRRIGAAGVDALNSGASLRSGNDTQLAAIVSELRFAMAAMIGAQNETAATLRRFRLASPNDVLMAADSGVFADQVRSATRTDAGFNSDLGYAVS